MTRGRAPGLSGVVVSGVDDRQETFPTQARVTGGLCRAHLVHRALHRGLASKRLEGEAEGT
ncbi:MAG: hypothetical protein ACRDPK_10795 [Carbonactinosporaceae bacterium]